MTKQEIDKHIQRIRPDATKGLFREGFEACSEIMEKEIKRLKEALEHCKKLNPLSREP